MPDYSVLAVYLHRIVDCSFLVPNVLSVCPHYINVQE